MERKLGPKEFVAVCSRDGSGRVIAYAFIEDIFGNELDLVILNPLNSGFQELETINVTDPDFGIVHIRPTDIVYPVAFVENNGRIALSLNFLEAAGDTLGINAPLEFLLNEEFVRVAKQAVSDIVESAISIHASLPSDGIQIQDQGNADDQVLPIIMVDNREGRFYFLLVGFDQVAGREEDTAELLRPYAESSVFFDVVHAGLKAMQNTFYSLQGRRLH